MLSCMGGNNGKGKHLHEFKTGVIFSEKLKIFLHLFVCGRGREARNSTCWRPENNRLGRPHEAVYPGVRRKVVSLPYPKRR